MNIDGHESHLRQRLEITGCAGEALGASASQPEFEGSWKKSVETCGPLHGAVRTPVMSILYFRVVADSKEPPTPTKLAVFGATAMGHRACDLESAPGKRRWKGEIRGAEQNPNLERCMASSFCGGRRGSVRRQLFR
jgi:hypothetical protein